jgi:hypothetical protein
MKREHAYARSLPLKDARLFNETHYFQRFNALSIQLHALKSKGFKREISNAANTALIFNASTFFRYIISCIMIALLT